MGTKATLTEQEASEYLGLSRSSLRQGRMDGRRKNRIPPPPFIKLGRSIRYLKVDLDAWLQENRVDLTKASGE